MDALVDGLLEELNCDVVFKIPIFGGIPIYESVVVTWIIMAAVFLLCFFLGRNLSVENPGRRQVAVEAGVKFLNDFFSETLGEKGKDYIPYLATVIIYIGIATHYVINIISSNRSWNRSINRNRSRTWNR